MQKAKRMNERAHQTLLLPDWLQHDLTSPLFCCSQGYGPLQAWAQELTVRLHKPVTQAPSSPVGFDVTIAPGASAALDALVS